MNRLGTEAPNKSDISDYIEHRDCLSPENMVSGLIELADKTTAWAPGPVDDSPTSTPLAAYQPFPVEVLPEPIRSFVIQASEAVGCDYAFVALPLMAALASAIGNTRRIGLKRIWSEPAIIWAAIVGDSGTMKSPAMELALKSLRQRQGKAIKKHIGVMEEYKTEAMRYELDLTDWKKSGGEGLPPAEPQSPLLSRCWFDDTTMEALAVLLLQNWRDLLICRRCRWRLRPTDSSPWALENGGREIRGKSRKHKEKRTLVGVRILLSH